MSVTSNVSISAFPRSVFGISTANSKSPSLPCQKRTVLRLREPMAFAVVASYREHFARVFVIKQGYRSSPA